MNTIIALHGADKLEKNQIGEKARNLGRLIAGGFNVPQGYVLTKDFFLKLIRHNHLEKDLQKYLYAEIVINKYRIIEDLILKICFPMEAEKKLEAMFRELNHNVAVRSSSAYEDTETGSNAGLFDSYLDISDISELKEKILKCYASAFTPSVEFIRGTLDLNFAVIIQEHIKPYCSGVAFSLDPVTLNNNVVTLNFSDQSADLITSGAGSGETIMIDKNENIIEKQSSLIDNKNLEEIKTEMIRLENIYKTNIDVEWCLKDNTLYFIQCRPIATVSQTKISKDSKILDLDEVNKKNINELGRLKNKYYRWLLKKKVVFHLCREKRIPI